MANAPELIIYGSSYLVQMQAAFRDEARLPDCEKEEDAMVGHSIIT